MNNDSIVPEHVYNMYKMNEMTCGGFIADELILAIAIIMLAGGSALDIPLYLMFQNHTAK